MKIKYYKETSEQVVQGNGVGQLLRTSSASDTSYKIAYPRDPLLMTEQMVTLRILTSRLVEHIQVVQKTGIQKRVTAFLEKQPNNILILRSGHELQS